MSMGTEATGKGLAPPSWMQGDVWGAPWWGQQAPNVGAAMLQQQDPEAYARLQAMQKPPEPQAPQEPQSDPYMDFLKRFNEQSRFGQQQDYPSGREYWGDNYGGFGQQIDQSRSMQPRLHELMMMAAAGAGRGY
jgi:hypothetical protein